MVFVYLQQTHRNFQSVRLSKEMKHTHPPSSKPPMPKKEGDVKGKDHLLSLSSVTKKPSRSAPMPKDEGDEKGKDHPISLSSVTRKPSRSAPMPKDEGDDKRDHHLLSLKPTEQTTVVISSSPTKGDPDIMAISF